MSDKLRKTSVFFQNAKSLAEILNRASIAVRHLTMQNQSHAIAKKILQFRNAQLLKKLSNTIQAIPDSKTRSSIKKKVIQITAQAWQRDVQKRKQISSSTHLADSSSPSVETDSFLNADHSLLNGSQKDALSELNGEIELTAQRNNQNECQVNIPPSKESEACGKSSESEKTIKIVNLDCETEEKTHMKVKDNCMMETVTEQPHVQLRILEASPNEGEIETNVQIKEKGNEIKTPEISPEETAPPQSLSKAKRRLQFRGSSDANTSDDDHLVIDLSDDNTSPEDASSPQKDLATTASLKTATSSPPIKKFPGVIPLYVEKSINVQNKLEISKPLLVSQTKSVDSNANEENSICDVNKKMVAVRTSVPGLMSIQPVEDKPSELHNKQQKSPSSDVGTLEGQMNSALNSANKVLDSGEAQTEHLTNGQMPLSLPQTLISSKSHNANGDIPKHSVDNNHNDTKLPCKLNASVTDNTRILKQSVPEEIVIDDSDDEVVEIENLSLSRTSKSSVQHSHQGLNTETESQVNL